MEDDLRDEIESINSIYGSDTITQDHSAQDPRIFTVRLPSVDVELSVQLSDQYPDTSPRVLGIHSVGSIIARGQGPEIIAIARSVLERVFIPGSVCLFAFIQEVEETSALGEVKRLHPQSSQHEACSEREGLSQPGQEGDDKDQSIRLSASVNDWSVPEWVVSEVVTEKKSTFVARVCRVASPHEAKLAIDHLIHHDKKIAKATHNISAYRIKDSTNPAIVYQDCDDDGEAAAGGRLLHLLQMMNVWDIVVVVSRWYGGVHLGPDRFRYINQLARSALAKLGV